MDARLRVFNVDMPLSEAMRLGVLELPEACAMVAADAAIARKPEEFRPAAWGWITVPMMPCPAHNECGRVYHDPHQIILHLFTHHHWAVGRVAEWVEQMEKLLACPVKQHMEEQPVEVAR